MKYLTSLAATSILIAILALTGPIGCGDDDNDGGPLAPATGTVTIHFDHKVGAADLELGVFDYTNAAGNNYSVERLNYYVSDIRLHRTNGTTFGVRDVHFRDADDIATRSYALAGVPNGTYNAVSFIFGLDGTWNVTNRLPAGVPTSTMGWPPCWGGGYHYMILEGKYKGASQAEFGYRTHTGRRRLIQGGPDNCNTTAEGGPDDVSHHHFFEVVLPLADFTINGDSWSVTVNMDINKWYVDPIIDLEALFPGGAGGIMINLNVQKQLMENGRSAFTSTEATKN